LVFGHGRNDTTWPVRATNFPPSAVRKRLNKTTVWTDLVHCTWAGG
jgi:hypothetical protein